MMALHLEQPSFAAGRAPIKSASAGPVELWCRDLVSCLQATLATVLIHAGQDPLESLGLHWEFRYQPGDVRSEEFYYPCAVQGDVAASLMPHHGITSSWHEAEDGAGALLALADEINAGRLVIAAVDNYYLPFRPAFGDVHAAHLVVIYNIDEQDGVVQVCDAMPPAFCGGIPIADFLNSWSSENLRDVQDAFFSNSRIDRRYLTIETGRANVLDRELLRMAVGYSLELFRQPARLQAHQAIGLAGLDCFLADVVLWAGEGDGSALAQVYALGWGMQAQASLHGELLRTWGAREGVPEVAEAGRLVESVAHAWTGLRMRAAHGVAHQGSDLATVLPEITRHARTLRATHVSAVAALDDALEAL